MTPLQVNPSDVDELPQDERDLRQLIATIESLAFADEHKALVGRELLAKLRTHLPPPSSQRHRRAA